MRLVIDTNVFMAGLLKDSIVRKILSSENIQFFIPEHALDELEKHKNTLIKKANINAAEFDEMVSLLLENIEVVPESKIKAKFKEAKDVMKDIDIKDSPFIATVLSIECGGLLTFDEHFQKQNKIKIFKIKDLINIL